MPAWYPPFLCKYQHPRRTTKVCCYAHWAFVLASSFECHSHGPVWCGLHAGTNPSPSKLIILCPSFALNYPQYDILSPSILSWLQFVTMAMHAYGHEWACQHVYNPCMVPGMGLLDGEGTERLWSRLTKLITIEWGSLSELPVLTRCRGNSKGMNQWGRILTWCLILLQVDWGAITQL